MNLVFTPSLCYCFSFNLNVFLIPYTLFNISLEQLMTDGLVKAASASEIGRSQTDLRVCRSVRLVSDLAIWIVFEIQESAK